MKRSTVTLALALLAAASAARARADDDPLAPWRGRVDVRLVCPDEERHSIHSYFNTCPESPDGRYVLFYTSTELNAGRGEVRIRHRTTGDETVLARNVSVEDAHRAACQQWVSGGRRVVFHDQRDGRWLVAAVDVDTGHERVLALDRLVGWGRPDSDLVPIYGRHWDPGPHRDLEMLDVATGEIRTVVTADEVTAAFSEWIAKSFGEKPVSIFFPVLSPDTQRVFFKMSTPAGGDARSKQASDRRGRIGYSLTERRFLGISPKWGHPSWLPDSRTVLEAGNIRIDSDTGQRRRIPELPKAHGDHPSASPDGKLLVTDTIMDAFGGDPKEWGVVVADLRGSGHVVLHHFNNSQGARSWRRSHPHPAFSPDGRRIYFNVSSGRWTQLYVAEAEN